MKIEIMSFGFKYGNPPEADIVLDVRHLRNPYHVPALRNKDGRDKEVADYVLENPEGMDYVVGIGRELARIYFEHFRDNLDLTVAVGCTGGHHRSVAIAELVAKMFFIVADNGIILKHREIT